METILMKEIVQQLKDVERTDLWIDENFEKKLATVTQSTVYKRPIPEMHSVAELMSHLIEWRKEVLSRLKGNPRGLEMNEARNWRTNDELETIGWKKLLEDFWDSQQQVIHFLKDKDDSFLDQPYKYANTDFPHNIKYLLTGLIHHDFYHLGQLGIIIKFLKLKETSM
ncbi:DinB family protein [Sphingobacterium sp. Lzh-3]|uniref:DinB family protein n=1 Tax=Sphingobacterium TaxID=28453 RepID=UPI002FDB6DC5